MSSGAYGNSSSWNSKRDKKEEIFYLRRLLDNYNILRLFIVIKGNICHCLDNFYKLFFRLANDVIPLLEQYTLSSKEFGLKTIIPSQIQNGHTIDGLFVSKS